MSPHLPVSGKLGVLFWLCLQDPDLREKKKNGYRNSGFSFGVGIEVANRCIAFLNYDLCPRLSEDLFFLWAQDWGREKKGDAFCT